MRDKRVLTIQDISCVGQCSLTVALPIISACGIETAILPSAVLSTHTGGFTGFTFRDLTEDMPGIAGHWKKEGISFDAVYTGYLGSKKQMEYVKLIMDSLMNEGGQKIIDPAMADNGKLYTGFDMDFVKGMAQLSGYADILLPNITEAAFITGMEYKEDNHKKEYIEELLKRIGDLGAKHVVLKGIRFKDDELGVAVYDTSKKDIQYYFTQRIPKNSHGTGDCYASALTGAVMQGKSLYDAAVIAADFVYSCIERTINDESHWYGVKFEKALPILVGALNR